jgi:hypothetical protein
MCMKVVLKICLCSIKFIMVISNVDIFCFHPSSYQNVWKGNGCENLILVLDIN